MSETGDGGRVTRDGVEETGEQAAHLRRLGCDLAQGYYFARPQSAERIDSLLRTDAAFTASSVEVHTG